MATTKSHDIEVEQQLRELAVQLRGHRHHPCLLFVSRSIQGSDVLAVRRALEDEVGEHLDVIVSSPGGDVGATYMVARELRRRFERLAIFVPYQAKSAATLLWFLRWRAKTKAERHRESLWDRLRANNHHPGSG